MASIERGGGGIGSRQAGHLGPIMRCAGADLPWSGSPSRSDFRLLGDHQPNSRATHGPQPSMTVRVRPPGSQSDCRRHRRPVV